MSANHYEYTFNYRQLLISKFLINNLNSSLEEEYSAGEPISDRDEEFVSDPPNSSVSLSETFEPTKEDYGDIDEGQFKIWLGKKDDLNRNVKKVCRKYGQKLRKIVPMKEFMYDSEHDLLFCRNAKVCS